MGVAELNEETANTLATQIMTRVQGEKGSETWLQSMSQALSEALTSERIDAPGLKIGEIMRKLQQ